MSQPIIQTSGLTKRYGDVTAVDCIDLTVNAGEIFAFLGPNGAGKTTTISMLITLARPTGGSAAIAGHDIVRERGAVRQQIGVVFQDATLEERMTAVENLRFHATLHRIPRAERAQRIEEVLALADLLERKDDLVETFSGGLKRRLEIARALLHRPRLLFLDEPTIGLDPKTRQTIWQHIQRLRRDHGVAVFFTTHYMDEAEYADRVAIMHRGRIIALDTPAALKKQVGGDVVSVETDDVAADVGRIRRQFGVPARQYQGEIRLEVPDGDAFIPRFVRQFDGYIRKITLQRPTLDDAFLKLTGQSLDDAGEQTAAVEAPSADPAPEPTATLQPGD